MTGDESHSSLHRRSWLALAGGLVLAAALCLFMWGGRSTPDPETTPVARPPAAPTVSVRHATVRPAAVVRLAKPVALEIPSIEVSTRLIRLGLQADGTVEVPARPLLAGWYDRGPPPGAHGSSVILGHVDSVDGPAVFYRLRELAPGDRLSVRLDDGTTVRFVVHSTRTYLNSEFPAQKVYGQQGRRELNLVTCGGDYDKSRGGYQSNLVVNARRV